MSKSYAEYINYTPKLVAELKESVAGLTRAEGVKKVGDELNLSDRQARRIYKTYIEGAALPNDLIKSKKEDVIEKPVKRLFYDIETSPNIVLAWKTGFKLNIGPESILKERAIISIGYKWENDKETHVLHWDENQDDKKMLEQFIKVVSEATEIVGHNLARFDAPWIRTRCLFHGLPPIPDRVEVDTLKWARRKFYFNSNKLDYIAKYLGLGGKIKTEFGLWKDVVLNKCPKAMEKMCTYCKYDVILLEKVWAKLAEILPPKTHAAVLAGGEKWQCPRTGSEDVKTTKTFVSASGVKKFQMQNKKTGSYYTIGSLAHEAYMAAKLGKAV